MDEGTYEKLLNLVDPKIQKQNTKMRDVISSNQRLSITLRFFFFATGNYFSVQKFLWKQHIKIITTYYQNGDG